MRKIYPWAIITAGLVIRCWDLLKSQPWYDESFTLLTASLPLGKLITATAGDVHPPAYYLFISLLLRILPGLPPVLVLRGSSVLLGLGCLLLFWQFTGLLKMSRAARLAALGILAFLPAQIFYNQDGRMYPLLQLLVLLQVVCIYQRCWWGLGAATLAALYTHNYALIYTPVLGLAGLLHEISLPRALYRAGRDNEFTPQMIALGAALGLPVLGWLPWAAVLLHQMGAVAHSYWIQPTTLGGLALAVFTLFVGQLVPDPWLIAAALALGAALALAALGGLKRKRVFLLLWLFLPMVLVTGASMVWKPVLLFRGFYPSLPALAALGGEIFVSARGAARVGRWLLLVPWLVVLGWQIGANNQGWGKAWAVWPSTPPSAVVVHLEDTSYITLRVLWPGAQHYLLNAGCPAEPGALSDQTRAALGYQLITTAQLPGLGSYTLAGALGPLATPCHERVYRELTSSARVVYHQGSRFGEYGIYGR